MELLEERKNELILLTNDRKLLVVEKNPYTILKYKYYQGKQIRFIGTDGSRIASIQEKEEEADDGVFECTFNGKTAVILQDAKIPLAKAILECQSSGGSLDAILSLWKIKYIEQFLRIKIFECGNRTVELTSEGLLYLPQTVKLEILEWQERADKGRVAKIVFTNKSSTSIDKIFTHELATTKRSGRQTVIVNEIAVALIGFDEVGQFWMHFVPPEHKDKSIQKCELWLAGGEIGRDELIDNVFDKL